MIRKLENGKFRLYSDAKHPRTRRRRTLGTFDTREEARRHEREVRFFKHRGRKGRPRRAPRSFGR